MAGLVEPILLLVALLAIYGLIFRGFFGKRRGPSARNPDGPAWASAMLGGFAAASIAEAVPVSLDLTLYLAVIVGLSCGLPAGGRAFMTLPGAVLGTFAALTTGIQIWTAAPERGTWVGYVAITACMVVLYLIAELARAAALLGRASGTSLAERALGYFAALELANFLLAPAGAGVLEWARGGFPAILVWLAVILLPIVLGAAGSEFLSMFSAGAALALLYLSFLGVGDSSFLLTMTYLTASMVAYWIVRWIIRGFSGRGLLAD